MAKVKKQIRYYVALEATWDILTYHDCYRDAFNSMSNLSTLYSDDYIILCLTSDRDTYIPAKDYFLTLSAEELAKI